MLFTIHRMTLCWLAFVPICIRRCPVARHGVIQISLECPERGLLLLRLRDETRMNLETYAEIFRCKQAANHRYISLCGPRQSAFTTSKIARSLCWNILHYILYTAPRRKPPSSFTTTRKAECFVHDIQISKAVLHADLYSITFAVTLHGDTAKL